MREGYTQDNMALAVTTPLGPDVLLLDALYGEEGISRLYRFTLEMRASSDTVDPSALLGNSATASITMPSGAKRYIHGIVSRFVHIGGAADFVLYSAELVPRLWLLTLGRDRVVYQNKTTAEILAAVLNEAGVVFEDKLTGSYTAREYCVRYDETAFDFISRLMEEDGIFYFFTFADGTHTMVLADAASAHEDCADAVALKVRMHWQDGRFDETDVAHYELESRVVGKDQVVGDYFFETPKTSLKAESVGSDGKGSDYLYPGRHTVVADGTKRAKTMVEAQQAEAAVGHGEGFTAALVPGGKFALSNHPRTSLNTDQVVLRVEHRARGRQYSNTFETFAHAVPYRAPLRTPRPVVIGSHTAVVVGPSGEEIWTDKFGRIKLQFHWDRLGVNDENSSCWVRVSQAWAGQGWGQLFLPRIGQEVIVSYIDGDPERPLVTGSVYNADQTVPVTLPGSQTQSTMRSRSTKSGTAGNELRFEDKKDSEQLYLHAQKDMLVEIENDLTTTVLAGAEVHTVKKGDRTVAVETGKETHTVKGTRSVEVTGNETHTDKADFTHDVDGNYKLTIKGNLTIDVTGSIKIKSGTSFAMEAGTSLAGKAGTELTQEAGTNLTNKAGLNLTNKASVKLANEATTMDNKASAMQTVDGGGMLVVKGGLVKIN